MRRVLSNSFRLISIAMNSNSLQIRDQPQPPQFSPCVKGTLKTEVKLNKNET